tara:strand:- start:424 stop:2466 length:2043 start_codon:yes stop_codon:yes gene_type:complete
MSYEKIANDWKRFMSEDLNPDIEAAIDRSSSTEPSPATEEDFESYAAVADYVSGQGHAPEGILGFADQYDASKYPDWNDRVARTDAELESLPGLAPRETRLPGVHRGPYREDAAIFSAAESEAAAEEERLRQRREENDYWRDQHAISQGYESWNDMAENDEDLRATLQVHQDREDERERRQAYDEESMEHMIALGMYERPEEPEPGRRYGFEDWRDENPNVANDFRATEQVMGSSFLQTVDWEGMSDQDYETLQRAEYLFLMFGGSGARRGNAGHAHHEDSEEADSILRELYGTVYDEMLEREDLGKMVRPVTTRVRDRDTGVVERVKQWQECSDDDMQQHPTTDGDRAGRGTGCRPQLYNSVDTRDRYIDNAMGQNKYHWSAATITFLNRHMAPNFRGHQGHFAYMGDAKRALDSEEYEVGDYVAHRPVDDETGTTHGQITIGDVGVGSSLCSPRGGTGDGWSNIGSANHCDIVIAKDVDGNLVTMGGNIANGRLGIRVFTSDVRAYLKQHGRQPGVDVVSWTRPSMVIAQAQQPGPASDALALAEPLQESKDTTTLRTAIRSALKLLKEDYIQNVYEAQCSLNIHKKKGGDKKQTLTDIRGIPGVTIVSVVPGTSREMGHTFITTLSVKFELNNNLPPRNYIKRVLVPHLRRVEGVSNIQVKRITKLSNVQGEEDYHG